MKISLEFNDLRDLLFQMPKFALLIAGDEPCQQRMDQAIAPDPQLLQIQPEDGVPFTANEAEAIRRILTEFAKDPETFASDTDTATERVVNSLKADGVLPEKAPWKEDAKEQASEHTPEKERPAQNAIAAPTKVSDADVRAAFNKLMKNNRRDAVVKILKGFGAKNFSMLSEDNYKAAADLAAAYCDMPEDEYKEALKG